MTVSNEQAERDTLKTNIYIAIGRALTSWSSVEDALCDMYCASLGIKDWEYGKKAFWAIQSLDAKLTMTDRIAKLRLENYPSMLARWEKDRVLVEQNNTKRNKIAHGTLCTSSYSNRKTPVPKQDVFFAPYFWSRLPQIKKDAKPTKAGHMDPRPKDRMYAPDIEASGGDFLNLQFELRTFATIIVALERDAGTAQPSQ